MITKYGCSLWSFTLIQIFIFIFRSLGTPQSVGGNGVFIDGTPGSFYENCDKLELLDKKQKKHICGSSAKLLAVCMDIYISYFI